MTLEKILKSRKNIKNILIKASGDVLNKHQFFDFAINKAKNNYVIVISGCGTNINKAFKKAGYDICFDKHGRVMRTWEERKIAREIIEKEEKDIQDKFIGKGVYVIAPLLYAGPVLCPINADNLVKAYYLGFDEIYVFTLKKRIEDKQKIFADYPKVKVIGV